MSVLASMSDKIAAIKNYFSPIDAKKTENRTAVRETEKGIFGTSNLDIMEELFKGLDVKDKVFLDMGSGDGRIVLLASLFFKKAIGIEFDAQLVQESLVAREKLGFDESVVFEQADYLDVDFSKIDVLFTYMDHEFSKELIEKLKAEFKGLLYSYESVYTPQGLKREGIIWVGQTPIRSYSVE